MKINRLETYDKAQASIPLGRLGTLDEVASALVSLGSARSGFPGGTNHASDEGLTSPAKF